jgi:hypothetical protein
MGCVSSGISAARIVDGAITGTLYPPLFGLLDNNKIWGKFALIFILATFLLSKGFAIIAFIIIFILVFLKDFLVSIIFNWQTSAVLIVLLIFFLVFAIIWSMVRTGVNQGILPAILFLVSKIINPIIRLFKKLLKMVGARLPFDEIDEDSLSEGMPTLLSLFMMVLRPLFEMLLSPLRANREDDSSQKCKSE